jgi:phosphate starvation-inducible PhoH-like protein
MSKQKQKPKTSRPKPGQPKPASETPQHKRAFHLEFITPAQKMAWASFDQHDVIFLLGAPGVGKSHLACAFAISEVLSKRKKKIVLTRPIVEAGGESIGYLPGTFEEKVNPYMLPLYDCMDRMLGPVGPQRDIINKSVELAPICFMRGRTFYDAVCIFDEAQNATFSQIKLFLTRFGKNSKVIITGDPMQSDLKPADRALMKVVDKLSTVNGIGVITFKANSIVRHPLIASILNKLEDKEENGSSSS